jgi:hypothetical protein
MRQLLLCGLVLLSSVAAAAQSDIATVAAPSPAAALPASPQVSSRAASFTQTATAYGSNNSLAFVGGGGLDIHMNPRTAFRVQLDYLGTDFFKQSQVNWQIGAGVAFNF